MRIIKILKYGLGLSCAAALLSPGQAQAITNLKQVQVTSGAQVDLLFDGKIGKHQIRTEFFNDIVQVVLTDAAVYPAKISSVHGGQLVKIFAYQYAPKLVRCRFTVKGKAEDLKDKIQINAAGKVLTVRFLDEKVSDTISAQAAQVAKPTPAPKLSAEEKSLLDKVTGSAPPAPPVAAAVEAKAVAASVPAAAPEKAAPVELGRKANRAPANQPLAGGKPLPGMARTMGKLMAVLALFFALAFGAKKLLSQLSGKSVAGKLTRFARKGLGSGPRKEKMIDVVSTHYLGPKKSISVVKVAGRTLVLGVTTDSINLITQLAGDTATDAELEELMGFVGTEPAAPAPAAPRTQSLRMPPSAGAGATAAGAPRFSDFSDVLGAERTRAPAPAAAHQAYAQPIQPAPSLSGAASEVRSRIRSRLEGLKQL